MKAIVKVLLERPGELRVGDVTRMDGCVVDMRAWNVGLEADDEFDLSARIARVEFEQKVLVAGEFGLYLNERRHCYRLYEATRLEECRCRIRCE